jgi:hypothetical protein
MAGANSPLSDQMGYDFGAGFGAKEVALGLKLARERDVVFDDPVVDHHHVGWRPRKESFAWLGEDKLKHVPQSPATAS